MTATWIACVLLGAVALGPMLLTLRGTGAGLHWRPAAMALYRAQLIELDRELADRRIAPADHAAAVLEVHRRLLAAVGDEPAVGRSSSREPLVLAAVIVLAGAFGLYAIGGRAELQAGAPPPVQANAEPNDGVRQALTGSDMDGAEPDDVRRVLVERGAEAEKAGDLAGAASAWHGALVRRFDPLLAVRTADAESRVEGRIGVDAATLFRRALATVPIGTPWRAIVERRLADAEPPG